VGVHQNASEPDSLLCDWYLDWLWTYWMRPEEVKVGQSHFIHPFRNHPNAGAKVVVENKFGVDMMVRLVYSDVNVIVFFTDLWRNQYSIG
jgi:hypothetical protein